MTPIMLTIKESSKYAPEYAIRRWVQSGELAAVKTGRKFLICEDVLIEFLRRGNNQIQQSSEQASKIRRIY